ncbi:pol [Symbiodinium sp. CCMP2592]|nr:pol [Symbiodinium sp. CCMP2592]
MTWNVGGLAPSKLLELLDDFGDSPDLNCVCIVLVQEIITDAGLFHAESDTWQLVYGKCEGEFRGEGIAHRAAHHSHHHSEVAKGGVITTLKGKNSKTITRALAGHIPHHATIPQTQDILHDWRQALGDRCRFLLGIDANETFAPPISNTTGCYATTGRGECILEWADDNNIRLPPQDLSTPSYHPYNQLMQPRRLDYLLVKGITAGNGKVVPSPPRLPRGGGPARATWGPRKLRPPHQVAQLLAVPPPQGEDPHHMIATLAKAITIPGSGHNKFHESTTLREMRRAAKLIPAGPEAKAAWKAIARLHKQEQRAWSTRQAEQAAQLDWKSLRTLQRGKTHRGWQLRLQDDPSWQEHLQTHMRTISPSRSRPGEPHERRCKVTPWVPFSTQELQQVAKTWNNNNKSTGPDGISHEAARELLANPQWGGTITYVLNDMLYTARIPEEIDRGVTVLLPKVPSPLEWGETRPITLSSTLLKLAAQLLLARGGECVRGGATLQWARRGRQGVELIATIRRVTQMARDWGVPTWLVKLDIRKAFDSVWQHSMSELVASRIGGVPSSRCPVPEEGGDQPWEALLWLSILETRSLNVAGAPIPLISSALSKAAPPQKPDDQGGPSPPRAGGSFLDDTYLWSQDRHHLQCLINNLESELAEDGLHIHPTKTAILHSHPQGGGTFQISNTTVACQPHKTVISTLGSPITFGEQTAPIIAEMCRRGRQAFAKHKQILLARTSFNTRMTAYIALVRNAALYAAETWPVNQRILKAANSLQAQHLRRMLHLDRRPTEQWAEWHIRSLRTARVYLQRGGWARWSTHILTKVWSLWGHIARGGEEVNAMMRWKDLRFWRAEQRKPPKDRVSHAARFNPEGDVERALESIGGTHWSSIATDRTQWQLLTASFIDRFDVPWATGKQNSIHDNLVPHTPRGPPHRPALAP